MVCCAVYLKEKQISPTTMKKREKQKHTHNIEKKPIFQLDLKPIDAKFTEETYVSPRSDEDSEPELFPHQEHFLNDLDSLEDSPRSETTSLGNDSDGDSRMGINYVEIIDDGEDRLPYYESNHINHSSIISIEEDPNELATLDGYESSSGADFLDMMVRGSQGGSMADYLRHVTPLMETMRRGEVSTRNWWQYDDSNDLPSLPLSDEQESQEERSGISPLPLADESNSDDDSDLRRPSSNYSFYESINSQYFKA